MDVAGSTQVPIRRGRRSRLGRVKGRVPKNDEGRRLNPSRTAIRARVARQAATCALSATWRAVSARRRTTEAPRDHSKKVPRVVSIPAPLVRSVERRFTATTDPRSRKPQTNPGRRPKKPSAVSTKRADSRRRHSSRWRLALEQNTACSRSFEERLLRRAAGTANGERLVYLSKSAAGAGAQKRGLIRHEIRLSHGVEGRYPRLAEYRHDLSRGGEGRAGAVRCGRHQRQHFTVMGLSAVLGRSRTRRRHVPVKPPVGGL